VIAEDVRALGVSGKGLRPVFESCSVDPHVARLATVHAHDGLVPLVQLEIAQHDLYDLDTALADVVEPALQLGDVLAALRELTLDDGQVAACRFHFQLELDP